MSWTYCAMGFCLALALLGLVLSLKGKDEVIRVKPFKDPRSAIHNNFSVGRDAK